MAQGTNGAALPDDPLWYQDAIIYQTHVRAFFDSDGDGIGDFRGLTSKLAYLEELGVNAIWLLPFYPSPLKDDGYDIADYTDVHAAYGTIHDFQRFLREAHRHGLRVITELVLNHTSDQHPWFRRARKAPPGSRERDFYVWSDTPDKYTSARVIFKDFEPSNWTVDPVARAYYWHRFYAHQPDLNFDNPAVHKAVLQVLDFWMRRGVDGLRLDAVPYLYEREGTSCENLPQTHAFLREFRRHLDRRYRNRMLLAEANQWPDDAAAYFGAGDECHMNFHFPIMPRMFMALRMEDRYPIVDILQQTPAIPQNCQWAMFLRNHDELTLEMVTDRERDYMYQAYARDREMRINLGIRRRLAPLLNNDRRAIELLTSLLFSLPGSPVLYYGDEIGMGDNVYLGDRNGVRTPMQWSPDRNAGFSRANPQRLYLPVIIDPQFHYESVNVEAQENNPRSLLWWMRRLIGLRKRFAAFGRGAIEFLLSANHKVLSFLRTYQDQRVLVVANLSRFAQQVDLDLSRFRGMVPVEAFGQTRFRPIDGQPYYLTLGPYAFYWFSLEPQPVEPVVTRPRRRVEEIVVHGSWEGAFEGRARALLEHTLPAYLLQIQACGERQIEALHIVDVVRLGHRADAVHLVIAQAEYAEGTAATYALPLAYAVGAAGDAVRLKYPLAVVAPLRVAGREQGVLYDALWDENLSAQLVQAIARRRRFAGAQVEVVARARPILDRLLPDDQVPSVAMQVVDAEDRRVVAVFADTLLVKTYRRLESSMNPDLEVGRFLTEHGFIHAPATAGSLEVRRGHQEAMTLCILRQFVPHEQTAWNYTRDALGSYFELALARGAGTDPRAYAFRDPLWCAAEELPPLARDLLNFYPAQAAALGRRTAELHQVLASDPDDPAFAPEPFTPFYQRSQYQALHHQLSRTLQLLRTRQERLPAEVRPLAQVILDAEAAIRARFQFLRDGKLRSLRIRGHGNYHLGKVLFTGKDFVIIDFEGDPRRSLSERRGKHSALRDVASMLRSFHYVAHSALLAEAEGTLPAGQAALEPWGDFWTTWVRASFLHGYLETAGRAAFVPQGDELHALLDVCRLEQMLGELHRELDQRPEWVVVPLRGMVQMLQRSEPVPAG